MKQLRDQIVRYYNEHATALYEHYETIGTREGDVDLAFALAGDPPRARVLELGCGHGREARGILQRTTQYTGIDASEEFINLAREYAPQGDFKVANFVDEPFEGTFDIIFSFAAFRHLTQDEATIVLRKAHHALNPDGILYISGNYGHQYEECLHEDIFGLRLFYMYNPATILKLAGPGYIKVHEATDYVGETRWFEIALKRT